MMWKQRSEENNQGFTLIELLVVIIILGILAATIMPQFMGATQDAKKARAQADINTLENALERFYLHMDRYPATDEGLKVLASPPGEAAKNWRGPYIRELNADPWNRPYQYRSPGLHGATRTYDLWSQGADGADGGEGVNADVTNWKE